jgi:predicted secreted protein
MKYNVKQKLKINKKRDKNYEKQIRELVVARLSAIPRNLQMAVGAKQYTIEELMENVESQSSVGKQIIAMQMQYLKDLASGEIYRKFDDKQ